MKIVSSLSVVGLALAIHFSAAGLAHGQQPDNSATNKDQTTTADHQSNAKSDLMLTKQARKAVIADKDLSTYAHNVKIIAKDGAVTLKGPVKSDDEKQKVASDVASIVSADKITNDLTVKQ